jgi:hypothetical protein
MKIWLCCTTRRVVQRVDEGMLSLLYFYVLADIGLPGSSIILQDFLPMVDD